MRHQKNDGGGHCLGLDVGGSATRWCLIDQAGVMLDRGETSGFSGHLTQAEVRSIAQATLAAIARQTGPVARLSAGVTGLSRNTPASRLLQDMLNSSFGATAIDLMPDIELACRAAFPDSSGIVVYAGTGSIAAYLDAQGTLLTAGGKGVLIDDAGGGYWIAVTAMRAILRMEDTAPASGWTTLLGEALARALGGTSWPHVRQAFYALDRGGVGRLALEVAFAANAGDSTALGVMHGAGAELAGFAQMLLNRTGHLGVTLPVILAGRAATLHPEIASGMQVALQKCGFNGTFACRKLDQALTAALCCLA
jgi:glucosamine kinase